MMTMKEFSKLLTNISKSPLTYLRKTNDFFRLYQKNEKGEKGTNFVPQKTAYMGIIVNVLNIGAAEEIFAEVFT